MDPPAELPLNGTHEELAQGKINWLPREERMCWMKGRIRESRWKKKGEEV